MLILDCHATVSVSDTVVRGLGLWRLQGMQMSQAVFMSSLPAKAAQVLALPTGMAAHANHCKFVQIMITLHSLYRTIPFAKQVVGRL